jgi:hypothetical protein
MATRSTTPALMPAEQFQAFFTRAVSDADFRAELQADGFGTLERAGFKADVAPEVRTALLKAAYPGRQVGYTQCGTCGVCGLCTLCGEINAGSGSAFLWATFFLGGSAALASPSQV